jgi:hypothetical protein
MVEYTVVDVDAFEAAKERAGAHVSSHRLRDGGRALWDCCLYGAE